MIYMKIMFLLDIFHCTEPLYSIISIVKKYILTNSVNTRSKWMIKFLPFTFTGNKCEDDKNSTKNKNVIKPITIINFSKNYNGKCNLIFENWHKRFSLIIVSIIFFRQIHSTDVKACKEQVIPKDMSNGLLQN